MNALTTVYRSRPAHIRWLIARDLPEILEIEKVTCPNPWTESKFKTMLHKRDIIGMSAEYGEKVVGFMIYKLCKNKIHLLKLVVSKEYQGQGVGVQMVDKLKSKLSQERRNKLTMLVREDNLNGLCFLRSQEFLAVKIKKKKSGQRLDRFAMSHKAFDDLKVANRIGSFIKADDDLD